MAEKFIRGVLIDVDRRELREVSVTSVNGIELSAMRKLIGCDLVDVLRGALDFAGKPHLDVWIDDDGFGSGKNAFMLPGWFGLVFGNGLILDHDDSGMSVDHGLTEDEIEAIRRGVTFHSENGEMN
ncbi:MAG: hypothetical protein AB7F40_04405 [Victivallaceae bacterium]